MSFISTSAPLARALADMTQSLRFRIDATEAFAADAAHEVVPADAIPADSIGLDIGPDSAKAFAAKLAETMPEGPWLFPDDELSDVTDRMLAAEIVREKVFRLSGDELPYTSTVVIDKMEEEPSKTHKRFIRVAATIVVERDSHKAMVIGDKGERLKRISTEARQEMERLMDAKVFL